MHLEESRQNWDQLGQTDPMWAVLTDPAKKGGKWDAAEFFQSGEAQITALMARLCELQIEVGRQTAFDFGCGPGRLSQALAGHFNEVHGVDIAPSMIEQAARFNRFPDRCHYHVNSRNDLALFEDNKFDFICSFIVFQHVPPLYTPGYLREFARILRPGGVAVFQLIAPAFLRGLAPEFLVDWVRKLKHRGGGFVPAFGLRQRIIDEVLISAGCRILRCERTPIPNQRWTNLDYIISKTPATRASA